MYGVKDIAKNKYLRETGKKTVFPVPEWGIVYGYMGDFLKQFEDKTVIITTRKKPLYDKDSAIIGNAIDIPEIFIYYSDIMLHMKIDGDKRMFGVYKDRYKDPIDCKGKQIEVCGLGDLLKVLI